MATRLRKSIWELDDNEVNDLKTAFEGIMSLPYIPLGRAPPSERLKAYVNLASVHGVFDQRCFHGALEFVFWHRIYMRYFEDALRAIVPNVTLPYFDAGAIYEKIQKHRQDHPGTADPPVLPPWCNEPPFNSYPLGDIKDTFYNFNYTARGQSRSTPVSRFFSPTYGFNWNDGATYRDPTLSSWFDEGTNDGLLNQLNTAINSKTVEDFTAGALENPHGTIHVMTGTQRGSSGIEYPGWMGFVPIASFDPVFWFHHSNVERHFKLWQQKNNVITKEALDAMPHRRPSFRIPWNEKFGPEFEFGMLDAVWEADVEYTPGFGAQVIRAGVQGSARGKRAFAVSSRRTIQVSGIDRSNVNGSFFFYVDFATPENTVSIRQTFFTTGVGCENCQEHPFLTLRREIPEEVQFPCAVTFRATQINGDEIAEFGEPEFNIRFGIHDD